MSRILEGSGMWITIQQRKFRTVCRKAVKRVELQRAQSLDDEEQWRDKRW
jgi:hypothetical protein